MFSKQINKAVEPLREEFEAFRKDLVGYKEYTFCSWEPIRRPGRLDQLEDRLNQLAKVLGYTWQETPAQEGWKPTKQPRKTRKAA
jgi:hypothetical protein